MTDSAAAVDENLWLEGTHDARALDWAAHQSATTLAAFDSPDRERLASGILDVLDSDDRVPIVHKRGDFYYNFWRDKRHPRGLWRRTTLAGYSREEADWEILLDVDELGASEGAEWVFAGAHLLKPENKRALIKLSPDGGDAVRIREYDLDTRTFVPGGFDIPTAKSRVSWIDIDTIFLATDWGPGSLSASGYPRSARRLRRGQRWSDAVVIHEVGESDLAVAAVHERTGDYERDLVYEDLDFYRSRASLLVGDKLVPIDVPLDATASLHESWLLVHLRSDWVVSGLTYPAGALVIMDFEDFQSGARDFLTLFTPSSHTALESWAWTRHHLILTLLDDVTTRLVVCTPDGPDRRSAPLSDLPELSTIRVIDTDPDESDEYWLQVTGFTSPSIVLRGTLDDTGASPTVLKSSPSFFDGSRLDVRQHWATSADGTAVPYFEVSSVDIRFDGTNPTLLSGYGGFQNARLPEYSGTIGRAWLERGGVYVLANIRGGGEFGPAWHAAALKANRPRAYEDFAAVARDLIDRGVTTPQRLGCEGRSNGGLLVGNMLTTHPDLFGAVVCGVPLLDMQRYTKLSAGASWIAEYGDPSIPSDWEFIKGFSPYHLLEAGRTYPAVLFYAATSDDRVGPAQARKMAARMQRLGIPDVFYFENTEGGHGGAVDNSHTALLQSLVYEFLWRELTSKDR